jgi:hypothetical protein
VPLFSLTDQVSVVQVRAQWSYGRSSGGESDWSFIMPRAEGDPLGVTWAAWETWLQPEFIAWRPRSWRLDAVRVEDRWPGELAPMVQDVRLNPDPLDDIEGIPPQCTPIISWRTGNIGRQNRGRTYMGPYGRECADSENILDPALSAVYGFAESMQANLMVAPVPGIPRFAIVSRVPSDPDWPAGHYTLPTEYFFLERWGVVRRRMGYDWRT